MNDIGIIYELEGKKALVLTPSGEFIFIERQNHMLLGQQVKFENQDVRSIKRLGYKSIGFASSIAAVFIAILIFMGSAYFDNAYGYVNIDINPGLEFVIDNEYNVVKALPLNDSANDIIGKIDVKNKHVKNAILELIEVSIELEYIKPDSNNIVLVSAALNDKKVLSSTKDEDVKKMSDMMTTIQDSINQFDQHLNIVAQVVKVTAKEREAAQKHNLSMGKYDLYLKTKEIRKNVDIEEVADMRVFELYKILNSYQDEENNNMIDTLQPSKSNEPELTLEPTKKPESVKAVDPAQTLEPIPTLKPTLAPEPTQNDVPTDANDFETAPVPTPEPIQGQKDLVKNSFKIQYFSEYRKNDAEAVSYRFRILNTGTNTVELKDVKIRYYFKEDANIPLNTFVYFFSHGDESEVHCNFYNITNTINANMYLEITFSSGSIEPEEYVYVQGAFYREDWSRFDQSNDYSYNPTETSYVDWQRITAYIKDVLVWGIEP
ncbi:UNVERIFIED_CONTAM: cellulose binding domain-containing protein [Acetivibrio alkalicellulosi]